MDFFQEWANALDVQPAAWDWESFGWGMLGGALVVLAVGGVVLYFAWPYVGTGIKAAAVAQPLLKALTKE